MRRLATILLIACCACALAAAEVAMLHPQVPETGLTSERVRDLLLGRVTTWSDGTPVILVLVDDPAADEALLKVAGRDRSRLVRGWKRLVYTGAGAMPLMASSLTEARDLVARHPGALALIGSSVTDGRCRFLSLVPRP